MTRGGATDGDVSHDHAGRQRDVELDQQRRRDHEPRSLRATLQSTGPANTTGALISNVTVFINPTRYQCTLSVKGPQAVRGNFESNGV